MLTPEVLERFAGVSEFGPGVMLTGQPRFEVFAETEKDFFLKVVDAQLTFEGDAVVLHQGGMDQRAKKK